MTVKYAAKRILKFPTTYPLKADAVRPMSHMKVVG
jgi:hypothetical protein